MRVTEPYIIFPRKLGSGRIVYYYQFRDSEGRRSSALSTGETSLSKAKRKIQRLYNEGLLSKESESITFKAFSAHFFDKDAEYYTFQATTGKPIKDSTLDSYVKILNNQLLPFFERMELKSITKSTIKNWIIWANKTWASKTINNAHGVLNIIFESALDKELINRNPLSNLRFCPIQKKERNLLTVEELTQIYNYDWSSSIQKQMFLMALLTGMRIGEISALKKSDVHKNFIDVKHTYSDRFGLGSTKTGENRKVPVINVFVSESKTEWFFEGLSADKPMLSHAVYNAFTRICDKLGIKRIERGITIHSLRNFFISYLQQNNISESKIKAVVGHKDKSNMTEHYTYWKPDMFPEVYSAQEKLYRQITGENNATLN